MDDVVILLGIFAIKSYISMFIESARKRYTQRAYIWPGPFEAHRPIEYSISPRFRNSDRSFRPALSRCKSRRITHRMFLSSPEIFGRLMYAHLPIARAARSKAPTRWIKKMGLKSQSLPGLTNHPHRTRVVSSRWRISRGLGPLEPSTIESYPSPVTNV
jgi:hypothetical protein